MLVGVDSRPFNMVWRFGCTRHPFTSFDSRVPWNYAVLWPCSLFPTPAEQNNASDVRIPDDSIGRTYRPVRMPINRSRPRLYGSSKEPVDKLLADFLQLIAEVCNNSELIHWKNADGIEPENGASENCLVRFTIGKRGPRPRRGGLAFGALYSYIRSFLIDREEKK